jgi:beta-galactosidase
MNQPVHGRLFLQEYELHGGKIAGRYANGHIAAVENSHGKGKTLLIGTFPGAGYFANHGASTKDFFAGLLDWAGIEQQTVSSDPDLKARLQTGAGGSYLWVVNPTRRMIRTSVTISDRLPEFRTAEDLWQEQKQVVVDGRRVEVTVEDRNAAVIRLR